MLQHRSAERSISGASLSTDAIWRRSLATGACSASSVIACSSMSVGAHVDVGVAAQHVLGALEILLQQDVGDARDQLDDVRAEPGDLVAELLELVVELGPQIAVISRTSR